MQEAIIYIRVSTKNQANEGFSLENQEKVCRDYAKKNNYVVKKVFSDAGESAKFLDRPEIINLLEYCSREEPDALIVHKLDRLARNAMDHYKITAFIAKSGTKLESATEPIGDDPSGKFMEHIIAGVAEYDTAVRAVRTKSVMDDLIKQGYWLSRAPFGYLNARDIDGKSTIEIDDKESILVKKIFNLFKAGVHTQEKIKDIINAYLPIDKNVSAYQINRILRNPIYKGIIQTKVTPEGVKGKHKPIIDTSLFDDVQMMLSNKGEVSYLQVHPDFPLRAFLLCGDCGRKMTGSWSKGKNKKYPYYHCVSHGRCTSRTPKSVAEQQFIELISQISPRGGHIDTLKSVLTKTWKERMKDVLQDKRKLELKIEQLETDKAKLLMKSVREEIDNETYQRACNSLDQELLVTEISLRDMQTEKYDIESVINYAIYFIEHLEKIWNRSSIQQKQLIQELVFPEGLVCDGSSYRTPKLSPLYEVIQQSDKKKSALVALTTLNWNTLIPNLLEIYKLKEVV